MDKKSELESEFDFQMPTLIHVRQSTMVKRANTSEKQQFRGNLPKSDGTDKMYMYNKSD